MEIFFYTQTSMDKVLNQWANTKQKKCPRIILMDGPSETGKTHAIGQFLLNLRDQLFTTLVHVITTNEYEFQLYQTWKYLYDLTFLSCHRLPEWLATRVEQPDLSIESIASANIQPVTRPGFKPYKHSSIPPSSFALPTISSPTVSSSAVSTSMSSIPLSYTSDSPSGSLGPVLGKRTHAIMKSTCIPWKYNNHVFPQETNLSDNSVNREKKKRKVKMVPLMIIDSGHAMSTDQMDQLQILCQGDQKDAVLGEQRVLFVLGERDPFITAAKEKSFYASRFWKYVVCTTPPPVRDENVVKTGNKLFSWIRFSAVQSNPWCHTRKWNIFVQNRYRQEQFSTSDWTFLATEEMKPTVPIRITSTREQADNAIRYDQSLHSAERKQESKTIKAIYYRLPPKSLLSEHVNPWNTNASWQTKTDLVLKRGDMVRVWRDSDTIMSRATAFLVSQCESFHNSPVDVTKTESRDEMDNVNKENMAKEKPSEHDALTTRENMAKENASNTRQAEQENMAKENTSNTRQAKQENMAKENMSNTRQAKQEKSAMVNAKGDKQEDQMTRLMSARDISLQFYGRVVHFAKDGIVVENLSDQGNTNELISPLPFKCGKHWFKQYPIRLVAHQCLDDLLHLPKDLHVAVDMTSPDLGQAISWAPSVWTKIQDPTGQLDWTGQNSPLSFLTVDTSSPFESTDWVGTSKTDDSVHVSKTVIPSMEIVTKKTSGKISINSDDMFTLDCDWTGTKT